MTYQSIADVDGTVDVSTVKRNLDKTVFANAKTPPTVTGKDGKSYPTKKPRKKKTVFVSTETVK